MNIKHKLSIIVKALMLVITVIAAVVIMTNPAKAGEFELNYGISTNHFAEYGYKFNEDNNLWIASYKFDDSDWGVLGATFENSYYNDTIAVAATYSVYQFGAVEFSVLAGVLKGYTEADIGSTLCPLGADSDVCFMLAPKLSVEVFDYNGITPKLSVVVLGTAVVVTVGVSYEF